MRKEILERLIAEFLVRNQPSGLAAYIAEILEQENKIQHQVAKLCAEETAEMQRRKKFAEEREQRWAAIQSECPHHDLTFTGDPSGGNDSFHECNLCKKMI